MRNNERGSVVHILGIGCLVLVIIAGVGGYIAYLKAGSWARSASATFVESSIDAAFKEMGLSDKEQVSAMAPVKMFCTKIRAGQVSIEQGVNVVTAILQSKAVHIITTTALESKFIKSSNLSDDEKKSAELTVGRFIKGMVDDKVSADDFEKIRKVITTETRDQNNNVKYKLKDKLTTEELKNCIDIMKKAADTAGIENKAFSPDLGKEIQKAINSGMNSNNPAAVAQQP